MDDIDKLEQQLLRKGRRNARAAGAGRVLGGLTRFGLGCALELSLLCAAVYVAVVLLRAGGCL